MDFIGIDTTRFTDADVSDVAAALQVESAALWAVIDVETGGRGFWDDGRVKHRFEAHIFRREANAEPPPGGANDYNTVQRAMQVNEDAALRSTSWGLGQIMGFNCLLCGVDSAKTLVEESRRSERRQLELMAEFLQRTGLVKHLRTKNWASFAHGYNGSGYAANAYDVKLAQRYETRLVKNPGKQPAPDSGEPPVLRKGDRGDAVLDLQKRLNKAGGFLPLYEDSIFGEGTEDRVIEFQKVYGLIPDGVVGSKTWEKLRQMEA